MDQRVDDVSVVEDAVEELLPFYFAFCCGVSGLKSFDSQCLLGFVEELGLAGSVWEEEEDHGSEEDGGKSLDNKEPSPWFNAMVDPSYTKGKCTSKAVR